MLTSNELLKRIIKATNNTVKSAAHKANMTEPQLNSKLSRQSLRLDDFLKITDALNVDMIFVDRETGEPLNFHVVGAGRRVRAQVDLVKYDTHKSNALANNFYADGVNEYTDGKALELYVDENGRYFFAEYSCLEGTKDRISPCSASDAAAFMEKYGRELHRKPKSE